MIFHTQCLKDILFLFVIMFPSAYIFFLKPFIHFKSSKILSENICTVIVYGLLAICGILMGDMGGFSVGPAAWWVVLAVVLGLGVILVEFILAAAPFLIKGQKMPKLKPVSMYYGRFKILDFLSIIAAAALEEIIFRQYMIGGLFVQLNVNIVFGIIISSFAYSMNHVYFGRFAVLQKMSSGLIFSTIYVLSGNNILLSVICHITQNLWLYFFSVSKWQKNSGKGGK